MNEEDSDQYSLDFNKRLGPEAYEAMDRADEHAREAWKKWCDDCIVTVARRQAELTSDDVLAEMQATPDAPKTHNLAALGPRMLAAAKAGILSNTNHNLRSKREEKHGIRHTVWESAIYEQPASLERLLPVSVAHGGMQRVR